MSESAYIVSLNRPLIYVWEPVSRTHSALSDDNINRATDRWGDGEGVWVLLCGRKRSTGTSGDSKGDPKRAPTPQDPCLFCSEALPLIRIANSSSRVPQTAEGGSRGGGYV